MTKPSSASRIKSPSFSPGKKTLLRCLLWAALVGGPLWVLTVLLVKIRLSSRAENAPSPFVLILSGTPFDVMPVIEGAAEDPNLRPRHLKPEEAAKVMGAKVFLEQAIRSLSLRNAEGRALSPEEVGRLITFLEKNTFPAMRDVFALSGTETVAALIQKFNGLGARTSDAVNPTDCNRELISDLKEENAIVRSAEFVNRIVVRKAISAANLANAARVAASEDDQWAWPLVHQLAVRCLQVVQNDEGLKAARFNLTFVGGIDVAVMVVLFCFLLLVLRVRCLRARDEERVVLTAANRTNFELWEQKLKDEEFKEVDDGLENMARETRDSAPVFHEMLTIVQSELKTKKNKSTPDALLVWTANARDEVASSRWLIGWCGRALPTIGFIWKVLGIALAMKDSNTIALASGPLDQAAAIANVSGSLGLAFTATFVAFVLSLLIGFVESWEAHYERDVLVKFEKHLMRLLLVPPNELSTGPVQGAAGVPPRNS